MKNRPIAVLGIANCFYNFGFFTLLAYSPLALGLDPFNIGIIFLGWGILLGISSYFIAPKIEKKFGFIKSLYIMLIIFTALLLIMGIWTSNILVMSACIVFSGFLFGNSNSLFTNAVMKTSTVETSTTSASFSFLRMIGGAIAPFMAGILAQLYSPNTPFLVGSCFVIASIIIIVLNRKHIHLPKTETEEPTQEHSFKVKDFMITDVISIKPTTTVKELLRLLSKNNIGGVPVVDKENKLINMISDGDVLRYLAPKKGSFHDFVYTIFIEEGETEQEVLNEKINATIDSLMQKKEIYSIKKEDTLEKAIQILSNHQFKKLPVIDSNNKVIGIISRGDVSNNLMKMITKNKN